MLRDGVLVGELPKAEITHDRMVKLMIGRDLKAQTAAPQNPVLPLSASGARPPRAA